MVPEPDRNPTFATRLLLPELINSDVFGKTKPEENPTCLVPERTREMVPDPNPTFATRIHHYYNGEKIIIKYSFFLNRTQHGWEDWHQDWLYYLKWAIFGYFWLPLFFNIFYQYSIHPRGGPRDERYFDPNL